MAVQDDNVDVVLDVSRIANTVAGDFDGFVSTFNTLKESLEIRLSPAASKVILILI